MKAFVLNLLLVISFSVAAQNIGGKWYGKLSQQSGGYRELYDFEIELKTGNGITGTSYAYIPYSVEARIGFFGYMEKDSIHLTESKQLIKDEVMPSGWVICIKKLHMAYLKLNGKEFLRGRWSGIDKENNLSCIPGLIILARNKDDVGPFLYEKKRRNKKLEKLAEQGLTVIPSAHFDSSFKNTSVHKLREIEVDNSNLQLVLNDYDKIDNDTVSVFLNRSTIIEKVRVDKSPFILNFDLDTTLTQNELLLFAENQGEIPPNTAEMLLIDGFKTHKIYVYSDNTQSAGIYLKLKPKEMLIKRPVKPKRLKTQQ